MTRIFVSLLTLSLLCAPSLAEAKKKKKKEADYVPGPAVAPVHRDYSLAGVMGKDARTVIGLLGKPVSDVREDKARKLQFTSAQCIVDAYFYPPTEGREPLVTWVSARVPEGRDAERNSCIASFRP